MMINDHHNHHHDNNNDNWWWPGRAQGDHGSPSKSLRRGAGEEKRVAKWTKSIVQIEV